MDENVIYQNENVNLLNVYNAIDKHLNFHFFLLSGTCLKDLKISVPEAVAVGDAALLSCYYNLENVRLNEIKKTEKKK